MLNMVTQSGGSTVLVVGVEEMGHVVVEPLVPGWIAGPLEQ